MKRLHSMGVFTTVAFGLVVYSCAFSAGDTDLPKAELPILTTSVGQDSGVMSTVNIVLEEAGIMYDYCDVPTVEMLGQGVGLGTEEVSRPGFHVEIYNDLEKYPKGTSYKTVIFAVGASLKGMGASGLTVNSEVNRVKKLVDSCKKKGIFTIAVHVGGASKRGDSDNEKMIDAVVPFVDYIIVTNESNEDGRFTKIAEEKGVSLTQIEYALNLVEIFEQVFSTD